MKKIGAVILISITALVFLVGLKSASKTHPNEYYMVYLDGKELGVISDKEKLEEYIDKKGNAIKEEFNVDTVYSPENLEIKKMLTYNKKVTDVEDIYAEIESLKPFTIKGFEFSITNADIKNVIYVSSSDIFESSVRNTIETFVGKDNYQLYNDGTQIKVDGVGRYIDNIYLDDTITYKETKIPVDKNIFTSVDELSQFLLFGPDVLKETYTVKDGDTIASVSLANEISPEEFLISNPNFSSVNNLLFPGQEVTIALTNPQIRVVVEEQLIEQTVNKYKSEVQYDEDKVIGYEKVLQKGEDGIDLVTRDVKTVNGVIVYAKAVSKVEVKPSINEVVIRGEKALPSVGNEYSWTFPTPSGYIITQNYEWRINPVAYYREFHQALDIAIGYGAHIYSANNGVVYKVATSANYGNYIIINHNNGKYTLYAHLSRSIVKVGQVVPAGTLIGYMGSTGMSTGPHVHFEYWIGEPFNGGYKDNPWKVLK